MPKVAKVVLFSIDELGSHAKSAALQPLQESAYNIDCNWWEQTTAKLEEMLGMVGFSGLKVDFSIRGHNSAMFTGRFSSDAADYEIMAEAYSDILSEIQMIPSPIKEDMGVIKATITQVKFGHVSSNAVGVVGVSILGNAEYDHAAIQHELDNFSLDDWESVPHAVAAKELMETRVEDAKVAEQLVTEQLVTEYLTAIKDTICKYIYEVFRAEYEYLCTDDALIETMRCEGMLFLEDGTRAPDFLDEQAKNVLDWENMRDSDDNELGYETADDGSFVYIMEEGEFVDTATPAYTITINVLNDGEFVCDKSFDTAVEAKLWAANHSLGEQ